MDNAATDIAANGTTGGAEHMGVCLQCPRCRVDMSGLDCIFCGFQLRLRGGVWHALPPERVAHYARFVEDYERIRSAEGRGSKSEDFYVCLPYKDTSRRNSRQWQIRARSYDYLKTRVLMQGIETDGRRRILDLGAGNCWMSFRLALAGYKPVAVDLLTNDQDGLGAAEYYRRHLHELFPRFRAELSNLPFQAEQFDAVIFNASFHYAEDYEMVMREALRCVRAGGLVIISDTPWYSREESGRQMASERHDAFFRRYGTASESISSLEYLTDQRLRFLEEQLSLKWQIHFPRYGFKWAMRPLVAKLRRRREPSRFRIYVVRKASA